MSTAWHSSAVALTGTIGSGKSTVGELLRKLGAFVVSADDLAREAVAPGTPGLQQIVQAFGKEVLADDGSLDRKKLGALVFADPSRRKQLEAITHPEIRRLAEITFTAAIQKNYPLLVYESPILFEAGLGDAGFKKIVLVTAPEALSIARIMRRDGLSEEAAKTRIASQMSLEEKRKRSDIIIENDGSLESLQEKIQKLFEMESKR